MSYEKYRGRSSGRILNVLTNIYKIPTHNLKFHENNQIFNWGELFATYEWENEDVPVFK